LQWFNDFQNVVKLLLTCLFALEQTSFQTQIQKNEKVAVSLKYCIFNNLSKSKGFINQRLSAAIFNLKK
jgi:hypothetical protein